MTAGARTTEPRTPRGEPLLELNGLEVTYGTGGRAVTAVRGVDLVVRAGEVVALVGESGSGKSTVSQAVVRQLPRGGQVTAGSVHFAGRDLGRLRPSALRRLRGARIGYVPQDPNASLNPLMTVGRQLEEVLVLHRRLSRSQARAETVRVLGDVGLSDPEARARQYPHQLSGGMKQRVLIGMAWSCRPELVIADEPTSALDVTVQKRVLDQIGALAAEHGTALLLVTHDLGVAADRADSVAVMQQGRVVEQGSVSSVFHSPTEEYTRILLAAAPGLTSGRMTSRTSAHPRAVAPSAAGPSPDAIPGAPLLAVDSLRKVYPLRRPGERSTALVAVDDVSFSIPAGGTVSIVGESGSGKTTTARIAARLTAPDAGTVTFAGQDVTALAGEELRQLRRHIQVVYQNPYGSLDPRLTVGRLVDEPLRAFRISDRRSRAESVKDLLHAVRLPADVVGRRAVELSGGQRQRVAIARALALRPRLVVLDEPVSALDVSVQEQILQLLVDLQAEFDLGYLFISHDLGVVRQVSDHVIVMQSARVVEQGPAVDIFGTPESAYTRELIGAIPGTAQRTGDLR